jgi:diguanylate cyclase (GGDEF)-like protein
LGKRLRLLGGGFLALPASGQVWWIITVATALAVLPWCLTVDQPYLPAPVTVLVGLINAGLVMVTAYRRRRDHLAPTFDYGGVTTIAVLVLAGPLAALVSHASERLALAALRNPAGERPPVIRTLFNLAWGCPAAACAWAATELMPGQQFDPLAAGATWWLVNGLFVGPMAALSRRRSWLNGARLALTTDGWLRTQELVLVLFAVLAWRTHPVLLGGVVLLVISQAVTGRRLFREYETARLDPLTQLPNRNALADVLQSPPLLPGVLMIDLDHFKQINDRYGHDAGDAVLVEVGQAIRQALRPHDFCARLGGEEFVAVLSGVQSDEEVRAIAERVREAVRGVRAGDGHVTASIGALRVPAHLPLQQGLRHADQATYRAKADGRDRVQLYPVSELAA